MAKGMKAAKAAPVRASTTEVATPRAPGVKRRACVLVDAPSDDASAPNAAAPSTPPAAAAAPAAKKKAKKSGGLPPPAPLPEAGPLKSTAELRVEKAEKPKGLVAGKKKKLSVAEEMEARLKGGKFRWLNEQLYTAESRDSERLFKEEPALFREYHEGYREQVTKWPANPLDLIARSLRSKAKKQRTLVADLGCGDGNLARLLYGAMEVHSFDLVAANSHVTVCDVARGVPLPDSCCDYVVSCLALMGTNWPAIVSEAHRLLCIGGTFKIAEVTSRLQRNVEAFLKYLHGCGFNASLAKAQSNTHFVLIDAVKAPEGSSQKQKPLSTAEASALLAPCIYKKR